AFGVGDEHGYRLGFACGGVARGGNLLGEIRRGIGQGCRGGRYGCWSSRYSSLSEPDQHFAVLIGGEPLALDQFHLHIIQRLVIELELSLEQTVRHATALAQESHDLIHDRDKVHPPSPPCPVLSFLARACAHHSISDRGDAGGEVCLYKRLNVFTLDLLYLSA